MMLALTGRHYKEVGLLLEAGANVAAVDKVILWVESNYSTEFQIGWMERTALCFFLRMHRVVAAVD